LIEISAVMKRKCRTCGAPLWLAWLLMGRPWQQRQRRFAEAADCIDLLPPLRED
jgi:hypothetical protein